MFEYGLLRCVKTGEDRFAWFFVTTQNGSYTDNKLEEKDLLKVLNNLGGSGWELAATDSTIGFIMKRRGFKGGIA